MFRVMFSKYGLFTAAYILVGVFHNTASPHLPIAASTTGGLHSWVQWEISILAWPLGLWHPEFTTGKWHP